MAGLTQAEIDKIIKEYQARRDLQPGPILLHFPSPLLESDESAGDPVAAFIARTAAARAQKPNPLK